MSSAMRQAACARQQASRQAREWLAAHTRIRGEAHEALAALAPVLLARVLHGAGAAICIGGPPGCGKSTLARLLCFLLAECGRPAVRLSLDDYYLDRRQRKRVSGRVHPLLQQRGVPGTHDWSGLMDDLDFLLAGSTARLELRVFDKSRDKPAPIAAWRTVRQPVEFVLLEGWCLGVPPQAASALVAPGNPLEAEQDPEAGWRRFVNDRLGLYHRDLAARIERYWYLAAPDWNCVVDWRWQQEQELDRQLLRDREAVAAFLQPFRRIVRHAQATAVNWASYLLQADPGHRLNIPAGLVERR